MNTKVTMSTRLLIGAASVAGCLLGILPVDYFTRCTAWSVLGLSLTNVSAQENMTLFDFTTSKSLQDWYEVSDTVRTVGMSKAVLALQKTQIFQRAVFFTMLNPQPNGAGFAGVQKRTDINLQDYNKLLLHVRGQGSNSGYKVVLHHKGLNSEPHPSYEQLFTAPMGSFGTVELPLSEFKPYFRGRALNSSEAGPLDKSSITSFGLQVYGGVYLPVKQSGTSSLEIDWIKAEK
ncbi:uncharacterized protein LOC124607413 isoform X1 [Schistocerca americana]|uniref:uncharacterized protein LOC124607413 isoform X1 n=2 Tax=Schistocerca americana TaxID=7009 RepID=UPI001F4FB629|nr:uncharacterized protein LOC124607413 isoform X1 [Schistocerca americana]